MVDKNTFVNYLPDYAIISFPPFTDSRSYQILYDLQFSSLALFLTDPSISDCYTLYLRQIKISVSLTNPHVLSHPQFFWYFDHPHHLFPWLSLLSVYLLGQVMPPLQVVANIPPFPFALEAESSPLVWVY